MRLPKESKKRIKEAYIGDLHWLETIREEIGKIKRNNKITQQEYEEIDKALELIGALISMNGVIIDTETMASMEKYYDKAHELYAEMKVDLTEIIGYEDMWEEI